MLKLKLHWQILIALALAIPAGLLSGSEGSLFGVNLLAVYAFIGKLFLNALKMLIVPLIISSIIVGIAGIGSGGSLGKLGGKTLLYYMASSLFAILIGLAVVNAISPGIDDMGPVKDRIGFSASTEGFEAKVAGKGTADVVEIFIRMVPTNIVAAAANGQMLGLIFFSLLFGFFMTKIQEEYAETQFNFWEGVFQTMMNITNWVMLFAPLGVFALVAKVVATTGFDAFVPLAWFFISVVLALALHMFVSLPLMLSIIARVNPLKHYRAMAPAMLTAFSTASSSATLPMTMECVEKNAGVSNRTTSFVLPLGATVNMDGTALYECVAAMFIAQAYGIELTFATQFTIVLVALLTSVGVAGIPAASLVAISIILATIGLPAEGIGLILAVDRILDMCRTSVNIFSDSCGAVIVGRLQGEEGILQDKA